MALNLSSLPEWSACARQSNEINIIYNDFSFFLGSLHFSRKEVILDFKTLHGIPSNKTIRISLEKIGGPLRLPALCVFGAERGVKVDLGSLNLE